MPLPKNKRTTSNSDPVALEQASPPLPEQQTFHEHLRALTRSAVRVVIEEVMREELKQLLGAAWRERPLLTHYRILYAGRPSILPFGMENKPMRPSS